MKTASIIEVANNFRTLVAQVSVQYDTTEFKDMVAPYITRRYKDIGSLALIPGTSSSYMFGCYKGGNISPNCILQSLIFIIGYCGN